MIIRPYSNFYIYPYNREQKSNSIFPKTKKNKQTLVSNSDIKKPLDKTSTFIKYNTNPINFCGTKNNHMTKEELKKFKDEISNITYRGDDGCQHKSYDSKNIQGFTKIANKENSELILILAKINLPNGYNRSEKPRFQDYKDIEKILKFADKKNIELIAHFAQCLNRKNEPLFPIWMIEKMISPEEEDFHLRSLQESGFSYRESFEIIQEIPEKKLDIAIELAKMSYQKEYDRKEKVFNIEELIKLTNEISENNYSNIQKCLKYLYDDGIQHISKNNAKELLKIITDENSTEEEINSLFKKVDYIVNGDFFEKINKIANNPELTPVLYEIFNEKPIQFNIKAFLDLDMTEEEFTKSVKQLAKTIKFGYKHPEKYLSDLSIETNSISHRECQENMLNFFKTKLISLLKASQYLDSDTVNQLMAKRTDKFSDWLLKLDSLTKENYKLLSKLIKCKSADRDNKDLTANEKIELCHLVKLFQDLNFDNQILKDYSQKNQVSLQDIKIESQKGILPKIGFSKEELDKINPYDLNFNQKYFYLVAENNIADLSLLESKEYCESLLRDYGDNPKDLVACVSPLKQFLAFANYPAKIIKLYTEFIFMCENIQDYTHKEIIDKYMEIKKTELFNELDRTNINTIIKESLLGNFENFISDSENKYGRANNNTKRIFEERGIDYNKWLKPEIPDINFKLDNQNMTIKMWDRDPKEDLFLGNKTTCCTAIGIGKNGNSTPIYLLNTSFNVVELYNDANEVVGMSRVFLSDVDSNPSLIMDNIELNNKYRNNKISKENSNKIRDNFFKYMNLYAKQISPNKDMQVYFYSKDIHVNLEDENYTKQYLPIKFIGDISNEKVYINSADASWINPKLNDDTTYSFIKVPKDI